MKIKNYTLLMISIVIILVITIIALSVALVLNKTKLVEEYIQLKDISSIKVFSAVPEDENRPIEFELTDSEIKEFIKFMNTVSVKRKYKHSDFDAVGYKLRITYQNGSTLDVIYNHYMTLNGKEYEVYGYGFNYIYETISYKNAIE